MHKAVIACEREARCTKHRPGGALAKELRAKTRAAGVLSPLMLAISRFFPARDWDVHPFQHLAVRSACGQYPGVWPGQYVFFCSPRPARPNNRRASFVSLFPARVARLTSRPNRPEKIARVSIPGCFARRAGSRDITGRTRAARHSSPAWTGRRWVSSWPNPETAPACS